ncbi:MAG: protein nirF [Betaproteobacteria bacterium]|nr:protein nirF [Betaproteobacteria bacterium]MDH5221979.1 protein nirF [Betaproteobacteria bacterium]MDH5350150.1 protein nirF [Betaproteobacteria bacterium]
MRRLAIAALALLQAACAAPEPRGTGDLGLVVERAAGRVMLIETSGRTARARVEGLGDLSHAAAVFSRDGRYAYVFGRDGGLTKVDLLLAKIDKRVIQAGNSIGGAISQDGRVVAVANYQPGGVRLFDAATLEPLAEVPTGSKVVGIADAPGNRFVFSLFEKGEIWIVDASDPRQPAVQKIADIGRQPYDGFVTPNGRYYLAGLFGEDGLALVDLWNPTAGARRVLDGYGRGQEPLPVYKMPHLRGWAVAGRYIFLPAIGRHEVLVLDSVTWTEAARIAVHGQPVFAVAQPGARRVWVNFAFPDNGVVQVIDVAAMKVVKELKPGRAVLHMEFTPRGEQAWVSSRDDGAVVVYDTASFAERARLPAESPSGIFLTSRAAMTGF